MHSSAEHPPEHIPAALRSCFAAQRAACAQHRNPGLPRWMKKHRRSLDIPPVTLALGGKSPAIVASEYPLQAAVERIVVSSHGGRQLGAAPANIVALPAIAHALGSQAEMLMDGGVLIGRPWIWALAAQGQAGVTRITDINPSHLITPQERP